MRAIIVAKTKMGKGACIGAIDNQGRSIRLLPNESHLKPEFNYEYEVSDVWELDVTPTKTLIPPHTETVLVHHKKKLYTHQNMLSVIERFLPPAAGEIDGLFNGLIQTNQQGTMYITREKGIPYYSTVFWKTRKPLKLVSAYDRYRYVYSSGNQVCSLPYVGFADPIEEIPQNTLVRLSLAKWWKPPHAAIEERCYLQLSGWYFKPIAEPLEETPSPAEQDAATEKEEILYLRENLSPNDQALFDLLKTKRLQIAKEKALPTYCIFHNRAIYELSVKKPRKIGDFNSIYGFGKVKIRQYGEMVLQTVADFLSEAQSPPLVLSRPPVLKPNPPVTQLSMPEFKPPKYEKNMSENDCYQFYLEQIKNNIEWNLSEAILHALKLDMPAETLLFKDRGWFYTGETSFICAYCDCHLHSFRKAYQSNHQTYHYWALLCVGCEEIFTPCEFDEATKQGLYASSELSSYQSN